MHHQNTVSGVPFLVADSRMPGACFGQSRRRRNELYRHGPGLVQSTSESFLDSGSEPISYSDLVRQVQKYVATSAAMPNPDALVMFLRRQRPPPKANENSDGANKPQYRCA
ncbi:hypothetical protein GCM10009670_09930 [Citricoccus alkalitolerans]